MTGQERAIRDLALAAKRLRCSAGSPPSIRAMAADAYFRAEATARDLGLLPTHEEIGKARTAWARGRVISAWRRYLNATKLPDVPAEVVDVCAMRVKQATAIAEEWGLDADQIVVEADREIRR